MLGGGEEEKHSVSFLGGGPDDCSAMSWLGRRELTWDSSGRECSARSVKCWKSSDALAGSPMCSEQKSSGMATEGFVLGREKG
jgi:hypothetical protein